MKKEADEYCEKIFIALAVSGKKIRFNELHRLLTKTQTCKMSKPTLIEHLNHLVKNKMIQRDEEDKQKVSYELNWKRLKQLQKVRQATLRYIEYEKEFKLESLEQQTTFIHAMLIIGELYCLKLMILDILEPENKLQNSFSSTYIRRLYSLYVKWLLDSCKDSEENAQKIIRTIDESIKTLEEKLFEIPSRATKTAIKTRTN